MCQSRTGPVEGEAASGKVVDKPNDLAYLRHPGIASVEGGYGDVHQALADIRPAPASTIRCSIAITP